MKEDSLKGGNVYDVPGNSLIIEREPCCLLYDKDQPDFVADLSIMDVPVRISHMDAVW